jgi:hypothetical protein
MDRGEEVKVRTGLFGPARTRQGPGRAARFALAAAPRGARTRRRAALPPVRRTPCEPVAARDDACALGEHPAARACSRRKCGCCARSFARDGAQDCEAALATVRDAGIRELAC